jgi:mismatch-specific thymine-DNA glycosylase
VGCKCNDLYPQQGIASRVGVEINYLTMSNHQADSEDGVPVIAFATHLQKFSYSPPTAQDSPKASQSPPVIPLTGKTGKPAAKDQHTKSSLRRKKRKHEASAGPSDLGPSPIQPKRRTTTKERSANDPYEPENKLVDSLQMSLMLVFVGLNPGLETARTGYAYAHPTNHFWPLLHKSGITPVRHSAADTHLMPDLYKIGNTNLCQRATRSGDGLSKQEQIEGAAIIEQKIAKYKPVAVCVVGKGIWDTMYKSKTGKTLPRREFSYGWQDENLWLGRAVDQNGDLVWAGARTFVCTSTSGLAADTKPAEKLAIMSELGDWVKQRRKELGIIPGTILPVKSEDSHDIKDEHESG